MSLSPPLVEPQRDSAIPAAGDGAPAIPQLMLAEGVGTFLLVLFGCGAVHVAVLTGALNGLWQVAIVWGISIMLAIYTVGGISGAHINPAVTLALAAWGRCPKRNVFPYILAQLAGAFAAAAVLFLLFGGFLAAKEQEKGVTRGEPGSVVTAMCYGEYFPNPGSLTGPGPYDAEAHAKLRSLVSHAAAFAAEVLGTMILVFVVFAVTDDRNHGAPPPKLATVFIGLTVAVLIAIIAPLTQACFNPARDFGPRCWAYLAGWKSVAIPGLAEPGWLTVYILAPILGGWLGAAFYERLVRPAFTAP